MAAVAFDPAQFVQQVQLALKHAAAGKPGPVAVLFSAGAINAVVGPATRPTLYSTDQYFHAAALVEREALAGAVAVLRAARRPVIIAGNGVRLSRAYEQLQRLAETLDAPVATTAGGKGVFNEFHPLALGVLGNFGTSLANGAVAGADLLVVVGSKLGPSDTANEHSDLINPARQNLLQIDVEPQNAAWTFPADDVIVGDAADVLAGLDHELTASCLPVREEPSEVWLAALSANLSVGEPDRIGATSDGRIDPRDLIEQLVATLPPTAIVCCDAGENRIFMTHFFRSRGGGAFLQPSGTGGMGYAIPAALATQLVFPDRTSVAICGDGGFAMAMNGMLTAVELGIPIVVVVLNNSALGWVRHGQGDRPIASEFGDFDYAAIARAMGCTGVRVESVADLGATLEAAMNADLPTVIDVVTSMDLSFREVTSHLAMTTSIE
jgi:acetolactate synthase-1/2/3 large subunit